MTDQQNELESEFLAFREREDMRANLLYIKLLQQDIVEFEAFLISNATAENKKAAFQRLMTAILGSASSWSRLYKLSGVLGIGPSVLRKYVCRTSAPQPFLFLVTTEHLKSLLEEEHSQIEEMLKPLEAAAQAKHAEQLQKWKDFEKRVCNPLPGNSLNCRVRYVPVSNETEEYPLELMFAYPCRGIYELSRLFPHVCAKCDADGKEKAHTHGRIILASEDGLLLLPHIIQTQAELMQAVEDLRESDKVSRSFVFEDNSNWYDGCKNFLISQPVVLGLPQGDPATATVRDLTKEKMAWFT